MENAVRAAGGSAPATRPPPAVLLVTHYYAAHGGGVEVVASEIATRLASEGWTIVWLASDCDSPPSDAAGLTAIPSACFNFLERWIGVPWPIWRLSALLTLWRQVGNADVIHLHDALYPGNLAAAMFAALRGKPTVVTQHVGDVPYRSGLLRLLHRTANRTLTRLVLRGAFQVLFVSPAVRTEMARYCRFRRSTMLVPNGVDPAVYETSDAAELVKLRDQAGRDSKRMLCLFVGRFVEKKGLPLVLELARSLPGVDWVVAGAGQLDPGYSSRGNVEIVRGARHLQLAALYRQADLLVLPSVGEGFPLVVQEALSCGTAVLISTQTADGSPESKAWLFSEPVTGDCAADLTAWRERIVAIGQDLAALRMARVSRSEVRSLWTWEATTEATGRALQSAAGSLQR